MSDDGRISLGRFMPIGVLGVLLAPGAEVKGLRRLNLTEWTCQVRFNPEVS